MKKLIIALFCGLVSLSAVAGGNIAKGEQLAKTNNCAACHGADFNKPVDPVLSRMLLNVIARFERTPPSSSRPRAGSAALPRSSANVDDHG